MGGFLLTLERPNQKVLKKIKIEFIIIIHKGIGTVMWI